MIIVGEIRKGRKRGKRIQGKRKRIERKARQGVRMPSWSKNMNNSYHLVGNQHVQEA
jgi:hypothetical protein